MKRIISTLIFTGLLASGPAYAKKSKREGFNFGASFGLVDQKDKGLRADVDDDNSRTSSLSSTVNPYIGYVVADFMNLGLNLSFENSRVDETIRSSVESEYIQREKTSTLKSAGLFTRFLFARVMYFEFGLGAYDRKVDLVTTYTSEQGDGQFVGQRQEYKTHGVGPGYHLGYGLELPIAYGFHFTTAYNVRIYQLRSFDNRGEVGRKTGRENKREVVFGLSYYYE